MIRIISDTHIGTQRKAGTTPTSQIALREHIFDSFRALMPEEGVLICNGDLLDGFSIEQADMIRTYDILSEFLLRPGTRLVLTMGNHDYINRADKLSSFHVLCHFLQAGFGDRVQKVDAGFTHICNGVWAIPHMPNQDLFDLEIERAIEHAGAHSFLLLHCNVRNHFADAADHSLNLSEVQMDRLLEAGWKIICGHEHQFATWRNGRVLIPGNQIVTSVSDCIGCDAKYFVEIEAGEAKPVRFAGNPLVEVDWRETELPQGTFIRVTGDAKVDEAADVVAKVSTWRRASDACVLSNAVKVEGCADFEALSEASFDDIKKVDVLALLLEELDEREAKVVKELLE